MKIYDLKTKEAILKVQNAVENICGVAQVFIELNSSTIYIKTDCEIDENIFATEIINAEFET